MGQKFEKLKTLLKELFQLDQPDLDFGLYAFRLRPEDEKKPMRVHFRLADVAEGEHGNVKAAEGKGA